MAHPADNGEDPKDSRERESTPATRDRSIDPTAEYAPDEMAEAAEEMIFRGLELVSAEVPIPAQLGKYTIQVQVGRGGMGIVWKGFDPDLQRTVAIKVLSPHLAQSQVARRRFQREARAAAAINHENVLTIHSVEEQGETPFLVMEFVSGQSLKEYIARQRRLGVIDVIRLSAQIAQGLAAAHAQGVIHRDVKPANVMLHEGATRVRLMDFGLARVAFDNAELTSHDHAVGTPAYMAPEQIRGRTVDARADLFSLGCVMYCMVTGHSPFHGRNHAETIHKIIDLVPTPLHDVDPVVPHVLSEMVEKLLAKNPDERYQSAFEVADVLRRLMAQLNQTPTDQIAQVLAEKVTATVAPSQAVSETPRPTVPRGRRAVLLGSLVVVVAGALAASKYLPVGSTVTPSPAGSPNVNGTNPGTSDGTDPAPVGPKLASITVGSGPMADCKTLREAIGRAAENGTITVVGPGLFDESITISGAALNGLTLKASPRVTWRCPVGDGKEASALLIKDVSRVVIEGFDFEVSSNLGRAVNVTGSVGDVSLTDCGFRHTLPSHRLSLVNLGAGAGASGSRVVIRNGRFTGADGSCYCLAIDSKEQTGPRVVCEDCLFESVHRHVLVAKSCPQFTLRGSVFMGGHTGLWLDFKPWTGDEQYEIVNNTFVGTRFWFSWADSVPETAAGTQRGRSRLCNNLILGGERTLGKPEQWTAMLDLWDCQSNWWERDSTTTATADRGGKLAMMHDKLDVPVRTDSSNPEFLVPATDSPLLTSGVGGNLPSYIGAKSPKP